jgi:hypothetical protein
MTSSIIASRYRIALTTLLLAAAFSAAGSAARAEGFCDEARIQRPQVVPRVRGHEAMPDLSGWWTAVSSTYRMPTHFSGVSFASVNGKLQGRVALFFQPDGDVVIANGAKHVQHLQLLGNAVHGQPDNPVAYWELGTLVVKTPGAAWLGLDLEPGQAHVTERISLKDPDTLQLAVYVIDPERPTQPLEIRVLYQRDPG